MADVEAEAQSIVSSTPRSERSVVALAVLGLLMTCIVLASFIVLWRAAPRDGSAPSEHAVLFMVVVFGAVGWLVRFTSFLREDHRQPLAREGRVARRGAKAEIT